MNIIIIFLKMSYKHKENINNIKIEYVQFQNKYKD